MNEPPKSIEAEGSVPLIHVPKEVTHNNNEICNEKNKIITAQPRGIEVPTISIVTRKEIKKCDVLQNGTKIESNVVNYRSLELSEPTTCSYQPHTNCAADEKGNNKLITKRLQTMEDDRRSPQLFRSASSPSLTSSPVYFSLTEALEETEASSFGLENNASLASIHETLEDGVDLMNSPNGFHFVSDIDHDDDKTGRNHDDTFSTEKSPNRTLGSRDTSYSFDTVVSLVKNVPAILNKWLSKPWYSSREDEVSIFPYMVLSQYKKLQTELDNEKFEIVSTDSQVDALYHLTYAPSGFNNDEIHSEDSSSTKPICFSIYRANDEKKLMDLMHLCDKKTYLFETIDPKSIGAKLKIEELVSQIRSKPHYQLIHVAIASDRLDFFSDESIEKLNATSESFDKQLKSLCHTENCYPVHLAVAMNRVKIVKRLLEINSQLFTETDSLGNNVWHHVSSSTCAQNIWEQCPESHKYIDERNNEGQTPLTEAVAKAKPLVTAFLIGKGAKFARGDRNELFLAMLSKNAQSVVEVVLSDKPEIAHERDGLGNTAIHVACYKESLNALLHRKVELGLDVDMKNNAGETPLLLYMSSKKPDLLPLLVTLYAHGSDLNATDRHGNTALHKAATLTDSRKVSMDCVRFLISAGADPNKLNDRGESPRHLAACLENHEMLSILKTAGADRCPKGYRGCKNECRSKTSDRAIIEKENDQFLESIAIGNSADYASTELTKSELLNNKKVLSSPRKGRRTRINLASFDGGGIRGLVIIQTLIAIEEALGEPLFKFFDWSAGTSTGSLIMAGLARGKSLRQMQQTYLLLKDRVFDGYIPPYDTVQLEKFIQDEFGQEAVSDIKYPRLMISAVNSEKLPVQLEMARNYISPDPKEKVTPNDLPLWKALRRSTAAPVLFKPSEDRYIDGGIISNNPALDLMSEVHEYNRKLQMSGKGDKVVQLNCIVSFGTGQIPCTAIDTLAIDSNSPLQSIKTIKNLAAMFIDQATASEGAPVTRSRQWADSLEVPFYRFSAPLSKNVFLSSTSDSDVCSMMWDSYIYCRKQRKYIESLVEILRHDAAHPLDNNPFVEI